MLCCLPLLHPCYLPKLCKIDTPNTRTRRERNKLVLRAESTAPRSTTSSTACFSESRSSLVFPLEPHEIFHDHFTWFRKQRGDMDPNTKLILDELRSV